MVFLPCATCHSYTREVSLSEITYKQLLLRIFFILTSLHSDCLSKYALDYPCFSQP